jgi:hypothetical protein
MADSRIEVGGGGDQTKTGTLLGLRRRAKTKWVEGEMGEQARSGGASDLVNRSVHEWSLDYRR